jgi:arylsulfatase A-like enzyme
MLGLTPYGFALNDYSQHLVHALHREGYHSALTGVQHIAKDPNVIGYDEVLRPVYDKTIGQDGVFCTVETVTPTAIEFLNNAPPEPFFLAVGFYETHREYHSPGPNEDPRYTMPPYPIPDTPDTRQDMASFKATARVLDEGVAAVLDALDSSGLADNTLVICTTDHGIAFPSMKCNLTDHGIGVMLIMRGPGGFGGGQVVDGLVSHVDLFPTLCDFLGIEAPSWLQGRSFMPLVRGDAGQINDEIFAESTFHATYEPQRAVRTKRWKYIRRYGDRHSPVMPHCDNSSSKELWANNGWEGQYVASEELYDLLFDPVERRSVADDPSLKDVLTDMRARLDAWMMETDDPLLDGPVVAPPNAIVLDPDSFSSYTNR